MKIISELKHNQIECSCDVVFEFDYLTDVKRSEKRIVLCEGYRYYPVTEVTNWVNCPRCRKKHTWTTFKKFE